MKRNTLLLSIIIASSVVLSSSTALAKTTNYTVKSGDTLYKIGLKTNGYWKDIANINNIKSPYIIYPGQTLKLKAIPTKKTVSKPVLKKTAVKNEYTQKDLNEQLVMAELWMQTSAEYRALCYQAYNNAKNIIDEETKKTHHKPLAIITDCDEAVIDNSEHDAGFIGYNDCHTSANFAKWVNHADAKAMPGAKELLNYANKKGVEIFYVTGRNEKTCLDDTIKNLKKLGFPCVDKKHMRLKTTSSNKEPRMNDIKKDYNVIIFMGDDAGDFPIGSYGKDMKERNSLVDANKNNFGKNFIILPNPSYGHWESSLHKNYWKLSPKEKDNLRKSYLKIWRASNK